ncbi:MAG: hypothetical protein ACJ73D_02690 [Pyrinomonadaceae bacterium]
MDTQIASTRVYYRFEEIEGERAPETTVEMAPASPRRSIFTPDPEKPGFWRQQFAREVTRKQRIWDWTFGVVMPLVCFYFDPLVFREWGGGQGILFPKFQLPVYLVAATSVMAMAAWLSWGEKLGVMRLPVACVMFAGALLASILSVVLFPFSMLGLMVVIGALGFTPVFTAVIFWRNAARAFHSAGETLQ